MILSVLVFDQYDLVLNNSAYYNFLLSTINNNNLFMLLGGTIVEEHLKVSLDMIGCIEPNFFRFHWKGIMAASQKLYWNSSEGSLKHFRHKAPSNFHYWNFQNTFETLLRPSKPPWKSSKINFIKYNVGSLKAKDLIFYIQAIYIHTWTPIKHIKPIKKVDFMVENSFENMSCLLGFTFILSNIPHNPVIVEPQGNNLFGNLDYCQA